MLKLTGLAAELYGEILKIPVIDCHEHLPTEAERVARRIDFTELFRHYTRADLECAGLAVSKTSCFSHAASPSARPAHSRSARV